MQFIKLQTACYILSPINQEVIVIVHTYKNKTSTDSNGISMNMLKNTTHPLK